MSSSRTVSNPDWLHNAHAGKILAREFMEPLGMGAVSLAQAIRSDSRHLEAAIAGTRPIDAELDLRLARYFRMSEGFFLGVQSDYELLEGQAGPERRSRSHRSPRG